MKCKKYVFAVCMLFLFIITTACTSKTEKEPQKNQQKEPPKAMVMINGETFKTTRGSYHWEIKHGSTVEAIIADAASPNQIAENMKAIMAESNTEAGITFGDGSIPQLHAYVWNEKGRKNALQVKKMNVTLPGKKGKHTIEIAAKWNNGNSSNTFVVEVK